ncbi:MAG TPA: hypothetical protein DHV62_06120 [Elusimicrobia bacterium]|jgi:putative transposase|nr:hypothetical protein [Elusimicrobiota bacterium]
MKEYFPPHIYQSNTTYFISSHTCDNMDFFDADMKKQLLLDVLFEKIKLFSLALFAWVVLSNHYHLLLMLTNEFNLPKFVKHFHGKSSLLLNKLNRQTNRKIWVNYWDRCIRSEKDFYLRLNYIHHNPVKHGVSLTMNYPYSSYKIYIERYGQEWIDDCFLQYPIRDFTLEHPD